VEGVGSYVVASGVGLSDLGEISIHVWLRDIVIVPYCT
jgi:hypothetical protein